MLESFENTYPVIIDFPVHWGEMDAFEHVNNVTYFRYFESARIAYFERTSLMERMREEGIGPILASTECRYRRALTYPDRIRVGARVEAVQEYGFLHHYAIYSESQQTVTTEGSGRIVLLDYNRQQKVRPDEAMLAELERLEGKRFQ